MIKAITNKFFISFFTIVLVSFISKRTYLGKIKKTYWTCIKFFIKVTKTS